MIHSIVAVMTIAGFALLLMAMTRHQQDWLRRKLPARISRWLRLGGLGILTGAFAVACAGFGWAYGAVAWFGWLSFGAALTLTAQTNRERILARLRR
ncbi:uncharacterized protein DUF3325 [Novosphingobium sp. PhB165]|uniref:DUF3325 domain-containing protein n=1 Tax=Novosphingobium sp. PhB165 TaxID=2485105 RepID=UPI001047CEB7|nr:DUF3325 domain-containing protein [Novosphingobium sp. PhB165]TCM16507.1 uncharacterized protein DUF3325 [Novosphingobium sp. PhB165]